ncbi:MAG: twin-arginine translocase TatA/TatE family subunit [Candidatus Azobacteroides sp.]|nr:twin-arginine translocase TatA/TatE family subunit [Candidatus Azobacteroides sp.]
MQTFLTLIVGLSMPGGFEWVIILVAILLLFGGKKIPELMKGIGKGVKGFKDGLKGLEDEINADDSKDKNA